MTDIVERLRSVDAVYLDVKQGSKLLFEAADEIERLRASNKGNVIVEQAMEIDRLRLMSQESLD